MAKQPLIRSLQNQGRGGGRGEKGGRGHGRWGVGL